MTYDLKSIEMPRVHGRALRALVAAVEQPGIGHAIRAQMLSNLGFGAFRNRVCDAPIAYGPVLPDGAAQWGTQDIALSELHTVAASGGARGGFRFETVGDFHAAYLEGRTTPTEVAERLLAAIGESERATPSLRVFIAHQREDLMRQAEASTARFRSKAPLSVLDGVPVPVKDELDLRGYRTMVGTRFLGERAAERDATVIARLRAAGALLPGKTNMHELGIGVTGLNPHYGSARNPYDTRCFTGGSSSGSAAAVAAGFAPIAVGADGGGSVRIPAGLCGVVGLKPTWGRVSEHGAAPLCWSVAHVGPIGATARDVAVAYAVMAGADIEDPNSMNRPPVHLDTFDHDDLRGLRLGVYRPWFEDADPQVVAIGEKALQALVGLGAELREIEVPDLDAIRVAHLVTIISEMAAAQLPHVKNAWLYGLDTRLNLALGRALTSADYVHAQRLRREVCARFGQLLQDVDGIVTPTTACTAEPLPLDALETGESNLTLLGKIMRFAAVANFTGLPAITFPAGYDLRGMPVGLHVMGRAWEEHRLLQLANAAERVVTRQAPRWHRRLLPS